MDIGQSSEADYEGSINKKMKFSPPEKLCVIFDLVNDYVVFIVDLNNDNPDNGFRVLPYPHLRFRQAIWGFCVVGATLYKFPHTLKDDDRVVCSYNLNREFDLVDSETKALDMLGCKVLPKAICYKSSLILIFSTRVIFGNRSKQVDFELYDPEGRRSRELPKLCVRRPVFDVYCKSALWHSDRNGWEEFKNVEHYSSVDPQMFYIMAFGLKGHTLIIQTDLGQQFSLNLESSEGWQLCKGGILRCSDQTYIVNENGLCLDGQGAYYNLKPEEVIPFEEAEGTHIDFAATWFGDRIERDISKSSMTLVEYEDEGCAVMCCVQIGYDTSFSYQAREQGYDTYSKLYWSVELLSFDVSKFPPDYELEPSSRDAEDEQRRLFKLIKSFKFCLDETFELYRLTRMKVVGLFPF